MQLNRIISSFPDLHTITKLLYSRPLDRIVIPGDNAGSARPASFLIRFRRIPRVEKPRRIGSSGKIVWPTMSFSLAGDRRRRELGACRQDR